MCYLGVMETYQDLFWEVPDPRVQGRCLHKLSDVLFISMCTLLSNGEDCHDMVSFALEREEWLRKIIDLPNGIPSHDTFYRVLQMVDPEQLGVVLQNEAVSFFDSYKDKLISIDGKKLRGVSPKERGNKGLYILSAWVSENGLCIGQEKVSDKSNEITAIPRLLDKLEISGSIVSIDAIGCQVAIAEKIISKGADYLLSVKGNQKNLHEEIKESFTFIPSSDHDEQWDYGHGRYETRSCTQLSAQEALSPDIIEKWPSARTLICVTANRRLGDTTTTSSRYYISSMAGCTSMRYNAMVRKHWGIENKLHWHLDVTFKEDQSRIRTENAPINMNILRKIALQKIKKMTDKSSLKKRRFRASLNVQYLLNILIA
jgi:predicted transposase YbfD/YdcC